MSRNFHKLINNHISPPEKFPIRPVVLNTWEACFFDIDEDALLKFAKESAKCGIDMLVMDDGWFGKRINDQAGLGDWWYNPDKFKDGLGLFVAKVKSYGIKFGIWIEPEMVNPDSDLFRAHPQWCLQCKGRENTLSRSQLVLDMSNPEVIEYLKEAFSKIFDGIGIDYIKWDMNRHLSEVGSPLLPPEKQKEVPFRYMLGTYELYRWFNEHFPDVMIENCSGGGGRYDLGMMKYSAQIWASDNTFPVPRTFIQYGSTMGYPPSVMSCHVSHPGEGERAVGELNYRYIVALNGMLGYEFHIVNAEENVKRIVKEQVEEYHTLEPLIRTGEYYRLISPYDSNCYSYCFSNADGTEILLSYIQFAPEKPKEIKLKIAKADKAHTYIDTRTGKEYAGEELQRKFTVMSANEDLYAVLFHFVAKS